MTHLAGPTIAGTSPSQWPLWHKANFLPQLGGKNSRTPSAPTRESSKSRYTRILSLSTGTSVIRVTAVDADDPTVDGHATVMYQILKGNEYFNIDNSGLYE